MTKVLLLGVGRWGANHLRNLRSLPVELYVAEVDSQRLDAARKSGLPESLLSADYRSFTDRVDGVIVAPPIHGEMSLDAADQVCQAINEFYGVRS